MNEPMLDAPAPRKRQRALAPSAAPPPIPLEPDLAAKASRASRVEFSRTKHKTKTTGNDA
eukprot:10671384-Alexandrium_andersonii.AAC.1